MPIPKNCAERLIKLLDKELREWGRFKELATRSAMSESNWKNVWYGRQRPNVEMLEWACREWPQYVLWLMTGSAYPAVGQIRPVLDEYRAAMHQDLWSSKRMKAAIALETYCEAHGLDVERLDRNKVPKQLLDALAKTDTMAAQELRTFLEKPELAWDNDGSGDHRDPIREQEEAEELGEKIQELPAFRAPSDEATSKKNGD